jgi:hypothetical protein
LIIIVPGQAANIKNLMAKNKKTGKRRFAGKATNNGFTIAILQSPFQTREAITFPF